MIQKPAYSVEFRLCWWSKYRHGSKFRRFFGWSETSMFYGSNRMDSGWPGYAFHNWWIDSDWGLINPPSIIISFWGGNNYIPLFYASPQTFKLACFSSSSKYVFILSLICLFQRKQSRGRTPFRSRRVKEEDYMDPKQGLCLGAIFDIVATNVRWYLVLFLFLPHNFTPSVCKKAFKRISLSCRGSIRDASCVFSAIVDPLKC